MNKPLTIARREFIESMSKLTADCGLPFSMLVDIFRDAAAQAQRLEREQYERDKAAYEAALMKDSGKEGGDGECSS